MTPYELSILLDIYVGKPMGVSTDTVLFVETMRAFMDEGLVVSEPGRAYASTAKLRSFMDFILHAPLPVQEWRMPSLCNHKEQA
jgi:hypothetical protein